MYAYKSVNDLATQKWRKLNKVRPNSITVSVIEAIDKNDFILARDLLKQMISDNMENPQPYNFLGIIYEKEGNRKNATKCYRVAYYMDQTYNAASKNLERVCEFNYQGTGKIEWGMENLEDKK